MPRVCGVKFRGIGKVYYFAPPDGEELIADDLVVVETSRGRELAQIASPAHEVSEDEVVGELKPILRRASSLDLLEMERYGYQADAAVEQCREEVDRAQLPMKIVGAEYSYDGSRLTFFFTAEQRVDFRELVRKLARIFKTRIELRQIGVRDEAKIIGGFGKCGRPLCCATWLTHFSPVSIRMAKQQDLPLSPMEISGTCGRLLCCLAYENNYYGQVKGCFPRVGRVIDTPAGRAKVIKVSVLRETVDLLLEDGSTIELSAAQLAGEEPFEDKPLNTLQQRLAESSLGRTEAGQEASNGQRDREEREPSRPPSSS
ncbi:MAG: stage 0 sporulation family protein, partial [Anaerolineae bacterium]|nr:stage 0 sporulation family protein [Anaerolineae bacterium]